MKIIEAMKRVKENKQKITDLRERIANCSANLSNETPLYGDQTTEKIQEWAQACYDLVQDNIKLLCSIQRTNLQTEVAIEIGGKRVIKTVSEWVWRRREYAAIDYKTWAAMTDRNLREGQQKYSTGEILDIKIVRHFDPEKRDSMISMYRSEPHQIDAALEVVNATTDLVENI